ILPLVPEETRIDQENHCCCQKWDDPTTHLFFPELGYFTEEPDPIDPTIDYAAEYKTVQERQNRLQHMTHL
ncbi:hypothetical protein DM01DRAFT_1271265, partial [Hesseltinella vesiculosa]